MRKLKYLLLVLILFPISVHAAENYYIAMDEGNKTTYYKFESQLINWIYYYSVSPLKDYTIKDANKINNIAYLCGFLSRDQYQATLQMLIWQNTHPEYHFYLTNENFQPVDNSEELEKVDFYFDLLIDNVIDFQESYQLKPNEVLTLKTKANLKSYVIENATLIDNNTLNISFDKPGKYIVSFKNKDILLNDNLITSKEIYYEPFTINIEVANYYEVTVNTYQDDTKVDNDISIYDINYNLIATLVGDKNTISLKEEEYIFKDNKTNQEIKYKVDANNKNIEFIEHLINGIKTDINITKICRNDLCFDFKKENDLYLFSTPLLNGFYDIYTIDQKHSLDLSNTKYYTYDANGRIYKINLSNTDDNNEELDNIKDNQNLPNSPNNSDIETDYLDSISSNNEISIYIPNTSIELPKLTTFYIYKKEDYSI